MANVLRGVQPHYYILTRETADEKMNHQLELFQQEFIRKTSGYSEILPEILNETKLSQLMNHVNNGIIGQGVIQPTFIRSSCQTANIVIYLQRIDNLDTLHELVRTLGFLTARIRDNNTLELELIATSLFYKGSGSNLMNTFLQSARDAGFENLYLYSLLSPIPFYQHTGLTYFGHTQENLSRGIKQKDYMTMDLQRNHIKNFDITKIVFDPPKPGTEIKVPTHTDLMSFMTPNKPFGNVSSEHLKRIKNMRQYIKKTKNGKKYLNANSYMRSLSRKRSRGAEEKGIERFKGVVRKVMNQIKSKKKKGYE